MAELKLHFFQAMIPFMPVFTIPFAPLWIRACLSPLLFTLGGAGIWWGIRGLRLTMQLARGIDAPSSRRGVSIVLGTLFYGGILAAALGSAYFAVALAASRPTVIAADGITFGATVPQFWSRFVRWQEIVSVGCGLDSRNTVRRLVVRTSTGKFELGNADTELELVREYIRQQTGRTVVRPCEREILDHSWSY